jgi:hypothetical protein
MKKWVRIYIGLVAVMVLGIVVAGKAFAQDAAPSITLTLKDNKFDQEVIDVPANQKITIRVNNLDATPEEFESHDLRREKIIPANGSITLNVGPLKAGEYKFVGEYHEKTAKGKLVAK